MARDADGPRRDGLDWRRATTCESRSEAPIQAPHPGDGTATARRVSARLQRSSGVRRWDGYRPRPLAQTNSAGRPVGVIDDWSLSTSATVIVLLGPVRPYASAVDVRTMHSGCRNMFDRGRNESSSRATRSRLPGGGFSRRHCRVAPVRHPRRARQPVSEVRVSSRSLTHGGRSTISSMRRLPMTRDDVDDHRSPVAGGVAKASPRPITVHRAEYTPRLAARSGWSPVIHVTFGKPPEPLHLPPGELARGDLDLLDGVVERQLARAGARSARGSRSPRRRSGRASP